MQVPGGTRERIDFMFKALIAAIFLSGWTTAGLAQTSAEIASYKRAVVAMKAGDWETARAEAQRAGPVARDIIEWRRFRASEGDFVSIRKFLSRRADWPGLKLLRRRSETNVPVGSRPLEVIDFFSSQPPQTGAGARALIAAYRSKGFHAEAEAEAVRVWQTMLIEQEDHDALLKEFRNVLRPHHEARLDMLLWRGARQNAERMYPLVSNGWVALARARLARRGTGSGVEVLIGKVPGSHRDHPGLAFEIMQWRARNGDNQEAAAIFFEAGEDGLGRPARWAGWRRSLARRLMRDGKAELAYRLASRNGLQEGSSYADLEWRSGYLALTYMNDGQGALHHFKRFRDAVERPISLGRAGYWQGRARESLGDLAGARRAYALGARHQTSFYGLLAAERAGIPLDSALRGEETFPHWTSTTLPRSSVFAAVRFFIASGERDQAEQFVSHMAETLPRHELGSLGEYVLAENEPHLSVAIAKQAARRGIVLPRYYFPVARMGVSNFPIPRELVLAITRQESEFDPAVRSRVGALGIMQLMPDTAREVAAYLDMPYSSSRMLSDTYYNTRLGTAYLDELLERYDGNVVLVAAAYNAGPGRADRWTDSLGDPRRSDMVDWIEHIPYNETRNYVMRVAEGMLVYRARLGGKLGPVTMSREIADWRGHERAVRSGWSGWTSVRPRLRPAPLTD